MDEAKYLVGIDLGTSNCAMAYVELARGADAPVLDFQIPQLVRPGETAALELLPSCIYLPAPYELAAPGSGSAAAVPKDGESPGGVGIVGEFARWQGARVPGRLVVSAKSWLCHPGVDRQAPILPKIRPSRQSKTLKTRAPSLRRADHLVRRFPSLPSWIRTADFQSAFVRTLAATSLPTFPFSTWPSPMCLFAQWPSARSPSART